jgi:hypothetical protein
MKKTYALYAFTLYANLVEHFDGKPGGHSFRVEVVFWHAIFSTRHIIDSSNGAYFWHMYVRHGKMHKYYFTFAIKKL